MVSIREFVFGPSRPDEIATRDVEPLEGTNMSLWNSQIPAFWAETYGTPWYGTPSLADRVWVANRCIQLNAQQIASMPVTFNPGAPILEPDGAPRATRPPAWVSNPDPLWYPNGVSDAIFAIVRAMYGYGFACLYVTSRYADGFPQFWTVLDSASLNIKIVDGAREYKLGDTLLDPRRIVQIDRDPGPAVHGTPAIRAYAQTLYGLLAAGDQSLFVSTGGTPKFYLKANKKISDEQAEAVQLRWAERTSARSGLPPVVPPEIDPTEMSFDPSELALLETQEFDARVIASAYGVPAILLNIPMTGGLNYQNPTLLSEQWFKFELRPTSKRIADALSAQMLPRGQWINFEADDLVLPATAESDVDDPQLSNTSSASPAQQPGRLTAVSGG